MESQDSNAPPFYSKSSYLASIYGSIEWESRNNGWTDQPLETVTSQLLTDV